MSPTPSKNDSTGNGFRDAFDLPRDVCYLNAAYMTPQPRSALQAALDGAARRARPWRVTPEDFFTDVETLRERFASLIGCSPENIAIVPSASYGISTAAKNLKLRNGEAILVLKDQFPSNYYPWQRLIDDTGGELCVVDKAPGQAWTSAILEVLDSGAENIRIVALPAHHWSSGELIDLAAIGPALRGRGAKLVIDVTQTVGACPFDIAEIRPDFAAIAGYKWLFCPYGVSFLYVADKHLDGTPIEETWSGRYGSEDFAALANYTGRYQSGARRYDVGQRASFANVSSAIAALETVAGWGISMISRELDKTNQKIEQIFSVNGFDTMAPGQRAPHFQSVCLPQGDTRKIAGSLANKGIFVSQRGNRLRIAPHVYTDDYDLDRLQQLLPAAMRD